MNATKVARRLLNVPVQTLFLSTFEDFLFEFFLSMFFPEPLENCLNTSFHWTNRTLPNLVYALRFIEQNSENHFVSSARSGVCKLTGPFVRC